MLFLYVEFDSGIDSERFWTYNEKKTENSIFRCVCCTKNRPLLPAGATAGAENKMASRSILYIIVANRRASDSRYLIEKVRA